VPIGDYQSDALTNVALHRWVGDTSISATWLDPAVGIDVSGAAGVAFNGNNPSTDYRTGTEFHVEGTVSKYLSKDFSIGPSAYFYDQLTGDGGAGDKLGSFEGRVAALGGAIGYNFVVDKIPISTSVKVYLHSSCRESGEFGSSRRRRFNANACFPQGQSARRSPGRFIERQSTGWLLIPAENLPLNDAIEKNAALRKVSKKESLICLTLLIRSSNMTAVGLIRSAMFFLRHFPRRNWRKRPPTGQLGSKELQEVMRLSNSRTAMENGMMKTLKELIARILT
jgi:hypothetical protein